VQVRAARSVLQPRAQDKPVTPFLHGLKRAGPAAGEPANGQGHLLVDLSVFVGDENGKAAVEQRLHAEADVSDADLLSETSNILLPEGLRRVAEIDSSQGR